MALSKQDIRILIVDDDEDDFFLTSDLIKKIPDVSTTIEWCYRFEDAIEHLKKRRHQIYFVDYRLGAKTGIDLLKEAVAIGVGDPIILLTGKGNRVIDIEAMEIGATDYLVKGELTIDKLERCIRYALDRSQTLKALKANETKFRNIFERSKDIFFVADKNLNFKEVNYAATEILGYPREQLANMSLLQLLAPEVDHASVRAKLLENGSIEDFETDAITLMQSRIHVILSASVEHDTSNEPYIQGMLHDITTLKKAEKANLQIEKLAAAGRLVRTLAHEVRNPLNNINMSVEQMQLTNTADENNSYLDIIQRNSNRINDLIKELLDSSRPTELAFEKHSLQTVMDDAISAAIDRITLQRINLQVLYDEQPAWIMADRAKLKIAFLNIIINAIEAIENRQGNLVLSVFTTGDKHSVSIKDNGSGIPEDKIAMLFEPYFTSKRNGLGLGLAATLNILKAHRAEIDVKSSTGEGTIFLISFAAGC